VVGPHAEDGWHAKVDVEDTAVVLIVLDAPPCVLYAVLIVRVVD